MKKILFMVMGVLALSMATSCDGKSAKSTATEADSVVVSTDSVAQVDSVELSVDSVEVAE